MLLLRYRVSDLQTLDFVFSILFFNFWLKLAILLSDVSRFFDHHICFLVMVTSYILYTFCSNFSLKLVYYLSFADLWPFSEDFF